MGSEVQSELTLSALLHGIVESHETANMVIRGICTDSRAIKSGDIFLALKGSKSDAAHFIRDVIDRGAIAVLHETPVDDVTKQYAHRQQIACIHIPELRKYTGIIASRFYGYPSRRLKMIGITGTDGKTSISHFIAQALQLLGQSCGIIGTVGNGIYGKLKTAIHTTPDTVALHAMLAELENRVQTVAMEVSSHGLDQYRVNGVDFDIAVLTNLTREHLDYHGDLEKYKAAKAKLFLDYPIKSAIINYEDAFGRELIERLTNRCRVVIYGVDIKPPLNCELWLVGENLKYSADGFSMDVLSPSGKALLTSKLLGRFNASNLLAVIAVMMELKFDFNESVKVVGQLSSVNGRMQMLKEKKGPAVVVDYAHTPNALQSVLMSLRYHCTGQLWCVFGCGGDRDKGKRPVMGDIAARTADVVIVTDDNPRTENSERIVEDILQGMQHKKPFQIIHDRKLAIQTAIRNAGADDLVLIAGKGHEDYQIIGERRINLSDAVVASDVLRELQS